MSLFDKFRKKASKPAEKDFSHEYARVIFPKSANLSSVMVDRSYKGGQQLRVQINER
jgi:hypothetical protein